MAEKLAPQTHARRVTTGTLSAQDAFTLDLIKSFVSSGTPQGAREADTLFQTSKLEEPARTLAKALIERGVGR